jgi:DNA modification methylase
MRLQALGYYLRQEIIWHKANALPESAQDRPGRNHEYLFLLSKSSHYEFHREKLIASHPFALRSVWSIPNRASLIDGSCAVFPEALVLACLAASTQEHDVVLDPFSGSATVGRVCIAAERNFLGVELNSEFAKQSRILLRRLFCQLTC